MHMEVAPSQNAEQEPSTQTDNAINSDAATENVASQPRTEGAIASNASTPVPPEPTNEAAATNEPENASGSAAEPENSDMTMDVDLEEPAATEPEASAEAVKVEEINMDPKPTEDKEAPTDDIKPVPEVATEGSTDTPAPATQAPVPSIVVADTDAQKVTSVDTTKEPTKSALGETPMDTTTDDKTATTKTTDATEARATDTIPVARTYTPQFKFTTFAPMVTLPTRNILSNFLKSDKNYVLKDIAAAGDKKKNKKRKTDEEGGAVEGEDDKAGVDSEESETKKNKLEGEEGENDGAREDAGSGDDDSSDSDSDSDSEGSVIDEMDEDAEAKEVKLLFFPPLL